MVELRWILHADLDAFYASVEQLDRPELKGRPVLVGGAPEVRGVVAAASYEARAFGVRSAMPMGVALRRCPQAIRVNPRFDRYRDISLQVMAVFQELTPVVEPLSLDEAYLDVSQIVQGGKPAREIAQGLKRRIKEAVRLNITVGGGTSKSVAKVASQLAKPDGLLVVEAGAEQAFLADLSVAMLWGIGPKTAERLYTQGIATIGQLAERPPAWFRDAFGRRGLELQQRVLGRDDSPVMPIRETKSVSAETTFVLDVTSGEALLAELQPLALGVARHLKRLGLRGKTVAIKLRLTDFTTFTRQTSFPVPVDAPEAILEVAQRLMERELGPGRSFRLIGVGVSNFSQTAQLTMFGRGQA